MKSSEQWEKKGRAEYERQTAWFYSPARFAKTAAWLARWEREWRDRWQHVPGKGYFPRPVVPAAPIHPLPAPSRTMEAHEERVRRLRNHPEL